MNNVHKFTLTAALGLATALTFGCGTPPKPAPQAQPEKPTCQSQQGEALADSRDGKTYKTAIIGSQTWLAENLNYEAEGSKCYENDPAKCQNYGRLYNWDLAMKSCPDGWHLPSNEDWDKLFRCADGTNSTANHDYQREVQNERASKFLKAANGWESSKVRPGNGTDKYGFAALPGGYYDGDIFIYAGSEGYWWSSAERDTSKAYFRRMYYNDDRVYGFGYDKSYLFSVRCLKD